MAEQGAAQRLVEALASEGVGPELTEVERNARIRAMSVFPRELRPDLK